MTLTIWHNPRCTKSRQALDLMRCRGVEPEIVEYLKKPPSRAELRRVIELLGVKPRELMRKGESAYRERGLADVKSDEELIEAMTHDPILIERPVIIGDNRAVIGRPAEKLLELV